MPRVIYSLAFDLLHQGQQMLLIAPLLPDGQSPYCRACAPKRRVVDLRPGDQVEHGPCRYRIKKVLGVSSGSLWRRLVGLTKDTRCVAREIALGPVRSGAQVIEHRYRAFEVAR